MTVFEKIKSMDMNEFAAWFEENCLHDGDPCLKFWDEKYCKNCESAIKDDKEYAYCELNDKCRYFKDVENFQDVKMQIKLWLESNANEKDYTMTTNKGE